MERVLAKVVVVGGGVVGCAIAWGLQRAGAEVIVFEARECGSGASWAAAGMLSPYGEVGTAGPFQDLAVASMAAYPEFVQKLERDSARPVHYVPSGRIDLAYSADEAGKLRERFQVLAAAGIDATMLETNDLHALEPHISSMGALAAMLVPLDAHIDNRLLAPALAAAAAHLGARIQEQSTVTDLVVDSGRCVGVRSESGEICEADLVVFAAGATGPPLEGMPPGIDVHAVHGEMIAYRAPNRLRHMVHTEDVYIIQRGSRLLVGATMETGLSEARITPDAREFLETGARRVVPSLPDAPFEQWGGLRPATTDGLPILGPDPELPGLAYATGHFRNGILLVPAMVDWARTLIGQPPTSGAAALDRLDCVSGER